MATAKGSVGSSRGVRWHLSLRHTSRMSVNATRGDRHAAADPAAADPAGEAHRGTHGASRGARHRGVSLWHDGFEGSLDPRPPLPGAGRPAKPVGWFWRSIGH